jgi:serine/threonine protein phosphatase PrpC
MAERLMHLAFQGGGRDNIGLVVLQCQMQMDQIQTLLFPLVDSAPITG